MSHGFEKVELIHAMIAAGDARKAMDQLRVLIQREPTVATWHGLMARASGAAGLHAQAELYARAFIRMRPEHPTAWSELGEALQQQGDLQGARKAYEEAVRLGPTSALACLGLSNVLADLGEYSAAESLLRRAMQEIPGREALPGKYSLVLGKLARMSEAVTVAEEAMKQFPRSWELAQAAAVAGNYCIEDPRKLFELHARFGELFEFRGAKPAPEIRSPIPDRRLKVGLISPDFRGHSVSYFVEPLLRHGDKSQVEYILFATGPSDAVTQRLRSCGHTFVDMFGKPKSTLVDRLRQSNLDMLIDLCGHMRGGDLELIRARIAPIQINYCGYPNTFGMRSVDYRLVDETTDPVAWSDPYAVEKLIRIEGCFLGFAPRAGAEEFDAEPSRDLAPTFGSFNAARKISEQFLQMCAGVLKRVPESRLIFKSLDFKAPECAELVRRRALELGIEPTRLDVLAPADGLREHLEAYRLMHVALDTYPYSGTTTTCEALSMGVPVVTLAGRTHPSRVSASLLNASRIRGCTAETVNEFVELAARQMQEALASPGLRAMRRRQFLEGPLCDGITFASRFQAALRIIWKRHVGAERGPQ